MSTANACGAAPPHPLGHHGITVMTCRHHLALQGAYARAHSTAAAGTGE
ncbi:hypothetical protein [Streptomyces coeruleorubidus]|uniref:Uncharacterized protein n=1 Tax=Streptomyces coeruleorubidus TaxID=116188 RepID=A0ABZ0KU60_STRC4|nr:hypothetical protein [Streptomyces coeruleorubidus]WOT40567.1 hypothetical protein R5U08_41425 [Streptomyces coeruleorubidus]WOT40735.1 hypothetical protein R5U08_42395 [Streptomyces coeruleorubidus]